MAPFFGTMCQWTCIVHCIIQPKVIWWGGKQNIPQSKYIRFQDFFLFHFYHRWFLTHTHMHIHALFEALSYVCPWCCCLKQYRLLHGSAPGLAKKNPRSLRLKRSSSADELMRDGSTGRKYMEPSSHESENCQKATKISEFFFTWKNSSWLKPAGRFLLLSISG